MADLEKQLADAVARGEWAEFQAGETLRSKVVRDLLLGLYDSKELLRAGGVRLRGATLEGVLDLSDCRGSSGEPLPPLLLHHCTLLGSTVSTEAMPIAIFARHAHLSRLSLAGCKIFGCVDLTDARVVSDFDIDEVSPNSDDQISQISARKCCFEGSISARKTRLRIPHGKQISDLGVPDVALDLAYSEIRGSIVLQPGFCADGGVNLSGARVRGDIWAEGADFAASSLVAFRAQSLDCGGTVALRASGGAAPRICQARGQVNFLDASIGYLDLGGLQIRKPPQKESIEEVPVALYLGLVRVRNNIVLDSKSDDLQTFVEGSIEASGARIDGSFSLDNLSIFPGEQFPYALKAANLRVGGNLILGNLRTMREAFWSLSARNMEIGGDCTLRNVTGMVNVELARIAGALDVQAAKMITLTAKDAEVRGPVHVSGTVKPSMGRNGASLCFDGGNYHSEFRINLEFIHPDPGNDCLISFEDARIERDLRVDKISISTVRDTDLEGNMDSFVAAKPSFYPGWILVETSFQLNSGRAAVVAFLQSAEGNPVLLTGLSHPIHEMNRRGALELGSDQAVLDYLRFFCAYVWQAGSSFAIVESLEDLEGAEFLPDEPTSSPSPIEIVERDEKGWVCRAPAVRYRENLFSATFRVAHDGAVEMLDDQNIGIVKDPAPDIHLPPLRILELVGSRRSGGSHSIFLRNFESTLVEVPSDARVTFKNLRHQIRSSTGTPKIVMCGLKAGALKHDSSRSWAPEILLMLDGFEYDRVEAGLSSLPASAARSVFPDRIQRSWLNRLRVSAREWLTKEKIFSLRSRGDANEAGVDHLGWLSRQHATGDPGSRFDYKPQPYEQLARVLRNSGDYEQAKRITFRKLCLERRLVHRWWTKPFLWIMEKFFDHGLFATKGLMVFLCLWLGGSAMFHLANHRRIGTLAWPVLNSPVLVIDSMAVSSLMLGDSAVAGVDPSPAMRIVRSPGEVSTEAPCGSQVDSLWYALDVFVPLLDLKQEEKCTISSRRSAWEWRVFKSLYAVTGAFVTSLVLLTISGVLRRRLEQ